MYIDVQKDCINEPWVMTQSTESWNKGFGIAPQRFYHPTMGTIIGNYPDFHAADSAFKNKVADRRAQKGAR